MSAKIDETRHADTRRSFEQLYEAHRHQIYRLGLRYGRGNVQWAEDLTHDVFVRLFEHLPKLLDTGDLGGWLYRVATNAAFIRLRNERSLVGRIRHWLHDESEVDGTTPEATLIGNEGQRAALEAVHTLPPEERMVMLLRLVDGKKQVEIAAILSLSKGQVSKLLARGRSRLLQAGWSIEGVDD